MLGWYAVKVMTSFGYETMLTRGCWFQTLDINKPWHQIPADRLLFLVFTHFLFFLFYFFFYYSEAIRRGDILFKSNHVIERNFEACKNVYLGSIFTPKKYVIRVRLVSPWTSLIPLLDIRVAPPGVTVNDQVRTIKRMHANGQWLVASIAHGSPWREVSLSSSGQRP